MSGNYGKNHARQASLTSSSKLFVESISFILKTMGVNYYLEIRKPVPGHAILGNIVKNGHTNYRIHLSSGKDVYNFVKLVYGNNNFAMPRKQWLANDIILDWESGVKCKKCDIVLSSCARNKKYCQECKRLRDNERQRIRYAQRTSEPFLYESGKSSLLDDK
jgi:hypothetical protein